MASGNQKCLLGFVFSLCNIVFCVLAFFIAYLANDAVEPGLLTPTPLPVVKDLINDWSAVPFVSMSLGPAEGCEGDDEDVFMRKWYGTERGCLTDDGKAEPRDTWKEKGNKLADC